MANVRRKIMGDASDFKVPLSASKKWGGLDELEFVDYFVENCVTAQTSLRRVHKILLKLRDSITGMVKLGLMSLVSQECHEKKLAALQEHFYNACAALG